MCISCDRHRIQFSILPAIIARHWTKKNAQTWIFLRSNVWLWAHLRSTSPKIPHWLRQAGHFPMRFIFQFRLTVGRDQEKRQRRQFRKKNCSSIEVTVNATPLDAKPQSETAQNNYAMQMPRPETRDICIIIIIFTPETRRMPGNTLRRKKDRQSSLFNARKRNNDFRKCSRRQLVNALDEFTVAAGKCVRGRGGRVHCAILQMLKINFHSIHNDLVYATPCTGLVVQRAAHTRPVHSSSGARAFTSVNCVNFSLSSDLYPLCHWLIKTLSSRQPCARE